MIRSLVVILVVLWTSSVGAVGVDSLVLNDPILEEKAQSIMKGLRCLVCQNQSIVDSDAPLAADLRQIVRERVALGEDEPAVQAYMVERYGDWVLLRPPVKRATYLLWFAPVAVLAMAVLLILAVRRAGPKDGLTPSEQQEADKLLQDGL